jgi:hypothetical protein
MDELRYNGDSELLRRIFKEYPSGALKVVCAACGEQLDIYLDIESAARAKKAPGLYCPNGHLQEILNLKK